MKILNLYAGIGGNRKLWGDEHDITAVELNPSIAEIYKDYFPNDTVIVADAHQYLLDHFKEFDFIWSSPPCPTHSRMSNINSARGMTKYPDMGLYQEIVLLKHRFDGLWVVENVISYYDPLIEPKKVGNHYYWANFFIPNIEEPPRRIAHFDGVDTAQNIKDKEILYGYDLSKCDLSLTKKELALKNCVEPKTGLHILNTAIGAIPPIQEGLFA